MTDGLLPPYGRPGGRPSEDHEVLRAFARGEPAGHSARFHVEGSVLVVADDMAAAVRIGPRSVLVRLDLPADWAPVKESIEQALSAEGMSLLDADTLLATAVAVQVLGLRTSKFDLWGADLEETFADLRAAAAGESLGGPPPAAYQPPEPYDG